VAGAYIVGDEVLAHLGQEAQQLGPQRRGVFDGVGSVWVFDDPIRWGLPILLLHQEAIGCQLEDVRTVGAWRRQGGFDLNRDCDPSVVNEVIGFTRQEITAGEEGLLAAIPRPGVGIDHPALGQSRLFVQAASPYEQKQASHKKESTCQENKVRIRHDVFFPVLP